MELMVAAACLPSEARIAESAEIFKVEYPETRFSDGSHHLT